MRQKLLYGNIKTERLYLLVPIIRVRIYHKGEIFFIQCGKYKDSLTCSSR